MNELKKLVDDKVVFDVIGVVIVDVIGVVIVDVGVVIVGVGVVIVGVGVVIVDVGVVIVGVGVVIVDMFFFCSFLLLFSCFVIFLHPKQYKHEYHYSNIKPVEFRGQYRLIILNTTIHPHHFPIQHHHAASEQLLRHC